jgi:glutamyl-tRNA synthetase
VVRGADLLSSTPRQIALLRVLGLPVPEYMHVPLVADADGQRMSKRDGSLSLRTLRERGLSPQEARNLIREAPLL